MKKFAQIASSTAAVIFGVFISTIMLTAAAQSQIIPHLDCAEPIYDDSGAITQYKAYYGYENKGTSNVIINDGPNNFFSPNPSGMYTGRQTTTFLPGYQKRSFFILISNTLESVTWIVQNRPAFSSKNPARYCDNGTSTMTYQGRLTQAAGAPANQPHDFEFSFFDTPTGGTEMQPRLYTENVPVTNGVFTAQLDMSWIFRKGFVEGKWMQIGVRRAGTTDAYVQLLPRQQLTAAPFAVNAKNVSGGFVQIPIGGTTTESCNDSTRGQMLFNTSQNRLYVCSRDGWKSVLLQ